MIFTDGYISGIGTLIDLFFSAIIAIRLYKPAKEENFRYYTFRGSFFWTFVFFSFFFFFMSFNLFMKDLVMVGLWGYTFGHIFLYLSLAVNIFTAFAVIGTNKKIPHIISGLILISATYITIINWIGYANGSTSPEYVNGVTIWHPPELVGIYIPIVAILIWVIFGAFIFWYHAAKTQIAWLRKRSILIGLGLFIIAIAGPLHDIELSGFTVLIADVVTSLGFIITALGIFAKPPVNATD